MDDRAGILRNGRFVPMRENVNRGPIGVVVAGIAAPLGLFRRRAKDEWLGELAEIRNEALGAHGAGLDGNAPPPALPPHGALPDAGAVDAGATGTMVRDAEPAVGSAEFEAESELELEAESGVEFQAQAEAGAAEPDPSTQAPTDGEAGHPGGSAAPPAPDPVRDPAEAVATAPVAVRDDGGGRADATPSDRPAAAEAAT